MNDSFVSFLNQTCTDHSVFIQSLRRRRGIMTRMIMILAALLLVFTAGTADAAPKGVSQDRVRPASEAAWHMVQRQITPQEARAIALSRVPGGEVVDIRRTSNAYRVRIIARNGQVVDIIVDATTGRIR